MFRTHDLSVEANVSSTTTKPEAPVEEEVELPEKGEAEKEHHYSMTIFFILLVIGKQTVY